MNQTFIVRSMVSASTLCNRRSNFVSAVSAKPLRSAPFQIRAMSTNVTQLEITTKNKENAVMVYSKTYCPYCSEVKSLFQRLDVSAKVVELDKLADGAEIQAGLQELTGQRTVPQVFIGGQHIGGCDDTLACYQNGRLKEILGDVGIHI